MLAADIIAKSSDPYVLVTDYVNEYDIGHGEEGVAALPQRLRDALLLLDLDSEWQNGGLLQYFGNRTDGRELHEDTSRVESVLNTMGAEKLAEVVHESREYYLTICEQKETQGMWDEFASLDRRFGELYESELDILRDYIRSHPQEFSHE